MGTSSHRAATRVGCRCLRYSSTSTSNGSSTRTSGSASSSRNSKSCALLVAMRQCIYFVLPLL